MKRTKEITDEQFLRTVPVERTESYTPIRHGEVIDQVKFLLKESGIDIIKTEYTHCLEGKIAQGNYQLGLQDNDMNLQLIWQNSTNKQISFKFCFGSNVFICSNGCVFGDIGAFRRVHTGDADNYSFNQMKSIIGSAKYQWDNMREIKQKMKDISVTKRTCGELIGRLFLEEEIITSSQLNIIKGEIEKPSFDYGVKDTLWNLYQHCTHSFKEVTPRTWLPNQMKLGQFIQQEYELV